MILILAKGPYRPKISISCCSDILGFRLPRYRFVVFGSPVSNEPDSFELLEFWEVVETLLLGTGADDAAGCCAGAEWLEAMCLYLWRSSRSS